MSVIEIAIPGDRIGVDGSRLTANSLESRNKKGARLINPLTGCLSFGIIPESYTFDRGNIYLKMGYVGHGADRAGAYGVRHIWEKHRHEFNLSYGDEGRIVEEIANTLRVGCDVYKSLQKQHRAIVLNTSKGSVILDETKNNQGLTEYFIVTAYGNRNPRGVLVGNLEEPEVVTQP